MDNDRIFSLIEEGKKATASYIDKILDKAENFDGLTPNEVASLLVTSNEAHINRIFDIAGKIKKHIYGDRIVMFAPLYVSDYCINNCKYCGFKCSNSIERRKLTMSEIENEVKVLVEMGHKRIALESGEDPVNCDIDYILECIKTIYNMKFKNGVIRRINVNIAATTVEDYKKLNDIGIGTYILFQETYHKDTYDMYHVSGPKKNYNYHFSAFDRAMQAGISDVGAGVLFGLYDPIFEVLGLMLHNEHLEKKYGVGFHTISMPRICKTLGNDNMYPYALDDEAFLKIAAIIRLAVPFTGMIISTRESADMHSKLIRIGISQLSGGSSVEVGGYSGSKGSSQFVIADGRPAEDIISWLMSENLIPSFCTACYRKGRTGDRFMSLAKSGNIKNVCLPNALLTLKEYSLDYGNEDFRQKADTLINNKLNDIGEIKDLVIDYLHRLELGERDLFL